MEVREGTWEATTSTGLDPWSTTCPQECSRCRDAVASCVQGSFAGMAPLSAASDKLRGGAAEPQQATILGRLLAIPAVPRDPTTSGWHTVLWTVDFVAARLCLNGAKLCLHLAADPRLMIFDLPHERSVRKVDRMIFIWMLGAKQENKRGRSTWSVMA